MKKIKTITTKAESKIDNSVFISSFTEYDETGNTLCQITYRAENLVENKTTFKYDENGKIIEEVEYLDEDEIAESTTYKRNSDGKIALASIVYSDGAISNRDYNYNGNSLVVNIKDEDNESEGIENYLFDEKDNIIAKEIVDCYGNVEEKEISEYDSNNNIIKKTEFDEENMPSLISIYSYNQKQELLLIKRLNSDGELIEEIHLKYNEKGKLIEQQFGTTYLVKYEYNEDDGSRKEERFNANGEMEFQAISFFDEEGFLRKEDNFFATINYEYTFFE